MGLYSVKPLYADCHEKDVSLHGPEAKNPLKARKRVKGFFCFWGGGNRRKCEPVFGGFTPNL
jgi:hypothetical protein